MNKRHIYILAILGAAMLIGIAFFLPHGPAAGAYDSFAQCLAQKNIAMYGAAWCPHCQNEKNAFGDSFRFVPYVECPQNPQACLALGISGYPTWVFPDLPATTASVDIGRGGRKLEGEHGLEKLSRESSCPLHSNPTSTLSDASNAESAQ